jgi:hypothetical protein
MGGTCTSTSANLLRQIQKRFRPRFSHLNFNLQPSGLAKSLRSKFLTLTKNHPSNLHNFKLGQSFTRNANSTTTSTNEPTSSYLPPCCLKFQPSHKAPHSLSAEYPPEHPLTLQQKSIVPVSEFIRAGPTSTE